jgi:DNA-binding NtrC family response regulator
LKKSDYKILIAEDDEIVRDVMFRFLQDEGYSIVMANDGVSAINLLRVEDIRLVLTDLRMPGADGMEVLRTATQINPKAAVVILTAYGTLDTALEAMKEGAYDYVVKPFVMQQLLLVVRNAFKMTNLIEENDELSRRLKELYHNFEEFKKIQAKQDVADGMEVVDIIDKLGKLGIIDSKEISMLRDRAMSGIGSDVIKKYSLLADGLKKINYEAD